MKLMIGLGNPGIKYLKSRHNVGHLFADFLILNFKFQKKFQVLKSKSFMNNSGVFVKKNKPRDLNGLYIVHDDLDLKLGSFKIQFAKAPRLHYGIQSVENELGTKDFWRIRIGVDARDSGQARMTGEKYVLQDFLPEELEILTRVFDAINKELIDTV